MNIITLLGRTTKDTELNTSGKVAINTIAVDRKFKDADGNKVTDFINLRWLGEKKAQFAKEYIGKGAKIAIVGNLCIENYEKDGNKRQAVYVTVDETEFCESKRTDAPKPQADEQGFVTIPDGIDEELPFN